jgi:hypothetical protein
MVRNVAFVGLIVVLVTPAHGMLFCVRKDPSAAQPREGASIHLRTACKASEIVLPLSLEDGGATVRFTGVNVQIVSGGGQTAVHDGKGNLIVGYNEMDADEPLDRSGSHNLVVGPYHTYASFAGAALGNQNVVTAAFALASGVGNEASAEGAAAIGGLLNHATANNAVVVGGALNDASGPGAVVVGGQDNAASGIDATVTGGKSNVASAFVSLACGGQSNVASGASAAVLGGSSGSASANLAAVLGGAGNVASGANGTVAGGFLNKGSGAFAVVSGGFRNEAAGLHASVSGGSMLLQSTDDGWSAGSLGATVGASGFTSP